MSEQPRKAQYQRNPYLEELLSEINGLLEPVETEIAKKLSQPRYPIIFVVGNPRAGKTLMMQWIANLGVVAYPSNLLSRFYKAPYIGAKIVRMLTDPKFSFRDEMVEFQQQVAFKSDIGKTAGALSPNEFYYFWRRFFPGVSTDYLHAKEMEAFCGAEFASELAAIVEAFEKPFALKGDLANQHVAYMASLVDKALFLYVKRDPFFNIQSVLQARERHTGSRENWWSFKPKEYAELTKIPPIDQVTGQVFYLNQAIEKDLKALPEQKQLWISYEDFCKNPAELYSQLRTKLAQQGCNIDAEYKGPASFSAANEVRLGGADVQKIVDAYKKLSGETLRPK